MTTTKDKLEFTFLMGRHSNATLRQCQALMRYAGTLTRFRDTIQDGYSLTEQQMNRQYRIQRKVTELCADTPLTEAIGVPVFSSDPRGAVVKIRVPDGGEVCVPA